MKTNEYLEIHKDIGLAYWVDKCTKKIISVCEARRLNLELIKKDKIEIKYF